MFCDAHFPLSIKGRELDIYLEYGWFRMGQSIFTTHFLRYNKELKSAIWLKINLKEYNFDKKHIQLRKLNNKFTLEVKLASVTPEKEELYALYKNNAAFEPSNSIKSLLFSNQENNIFTTYEITVRDQERLIACGYFDIGQESAMGISCFYHPDYKKFSLGKLLIYTKLEICKKYGFKYFYPGYFVPGNKKFDYKLQIGTSQLSYLDIYSDKWKPISNFDYAAIPIEIMNSKLNEISELMHSFSMHHQIYFYQFFDINMSKNICGHLLFDFPKVIIFPFLENVNEMIFLVFDVRDMQYHLIQCLSFAHTPPDENQKWKFENHIFKSFEKLFSSKEAFEIVLACKHYIPNFQ